MKKIEITLAHNFNTSDVNDLMLVETKGFKKNVVLYQPSEGVGGSGWDGIIIFIPFTIAVGFLSAIGEDLYKSFKEVLLKKKKA